MFKKKTVSILLAAAMLVAAFSACNSGGGSSSTAPAADPSSDAPAASTEEGGAAETPSGDQYGGGIKLAAEASPVTLYLPQSSTTGDRYYTAPAAEPLARENAAGDFVPFLAEDLVTDVENLTFTIKLRPDVYFHDGSPCDAEAVKWNLDQYVENGKASELNNPTSIEVEDDLTVVIHYSEWANNWDAVVGSIQIISKQAYDTNGEEWCKINVVGTGPFVMDSYVQDGHLRYSRNESYRQAGMPYLDSVEFIVMPDANTRVSSFLNKEIDVVDTLESVVIDTLVAAGYENVSPKNANLGNIKYVIMNSKDQEKPLGDLRVRQAVMHGMDWENIAKSLSGGYGDASPLFASPDSWAYHPEAAFYEYNVEKAKALLAEAGYPDGFSTKITTISTYNEIAVALQAALAPIGINAEIEVMDDSALAAMQVNDNIEGFIAWRGSGMMDFTANYIRLYSSEGIKNHGIIDYPADYEAALFGARAATTIEEKKALLQDAAKKLVQDNCLIFPVSVLYVNCFQQEDVHDTGLFTTNGTQWTPEAAWRG